MKNYHKVTYKDCLSMATKEEKDRLKKTTDTLLVKKLARRWCEANNYNLDGYLGWSKGDGYSWVAIIK